MARSALFILLTICTQHLFAQDISGKWTGNYMGYDAVANSMSKLEVEIQLVDSTTIKGTSYLEYSTGGYEKYEINGTYNREKKTVFFSEDKEISVHIGMGLNYTGDYSMVLSTKENKMKLDGRWEAHNMTGSNSHSTVWLEKSLPPKPVPQHQQDTIVNSVPDKAVALKAKKAKHYDQLNRITDIQKTIELDSNELKNIHIEFRDYLRIDNDEISVFLNDSMLIDHKALTKDPLKASFSVNNNKEYVVKVAAESYGAMPPCTTQMTIITAINKYVIDLSSSFEKNASVAFRIK